MNGSLPLEIAAHDGRLHFAGFGVTERFLRLALMKQNKTKLLMCK